MELSNLIQLGIGGVAIGAMVIIVRDVLKRSAEKSAQFMQFINTQQKDFNEMIINHLKHNTEAMTRTEKSNDRLAQTVTQLLQWLTKNNK